MKYLNFLVGASGTGKTTIINELNKSYNVEAKEVSARPFLPKNGSYDQTLTDEIQSVIVYNRTLTTLEDILKNTYKKAFYNPVVYSRSPIDNLAYQRVLKKGEFMDLSVKREIQILNEYANFFYIPIEFPLDPTDEIRGLNEKVRYNTDKSILDIFSEFRIQYYTIKGTIEERFELLKYFFHQCKKS